jgi:hypothetical protein
MNPTKPGRTTMVRPGFSLQSKFAPEVEGLRVEGRGQAGSHP